MTQPTPIVGFEPVEQSIDKVYYYHSDHLGSSTYVTDDNGRPVTYYDYLPFGEVAVEHNQTTNFNNGYKFNAKELDEATGMSYYGARYYDSRLSVFVSVDPLAEEFVGWTPYHYVHQNPINLIDPTGMSADGWIGKKNGNIINWKWDSAVSNEKEAIQKYGNDVEFYAGGNRLFTEEGSGRKVNLTTDGKVVPVQDFSNQTTAGQIGGGMLVNTIKDAAEVRADKSYYRFGSSHYSNLIDFMSGNHPNVGVNFYEKGYKVSMNQMNNLSKAMGVFSKGLDGLGFVDGGYKIYNKDYLNGGVSISNNLISMKIASSLGWGVGLWYSASYSASEYFLTRSEWYNKVFFGEGSERYNERKHHWQKSKLLNK